MKWRANYFWFPHVTMLVAGLAHQAVSAQGAGSTTPPTQVLNYSLLPDSRLTDDCPICDRLTTPQPMQGVFQLRVLEDNPLSARYAVEGVSLTANDPAGQPRTFTGQGTFTVGGEVGVTQEMCLELWSSDGSAAGPYYFTNSNRAVERLWPMMKLSLGQTNGTMLQTYYLDMYAAPLKEIWFSTARSFHAGIWQPPTNYVSAGDLISSAGRMVKRNSELAGCLGFMPPLPDLGLDAINFVPGGEMVFSVGQAGFSETLGALGPGDLLSDKGRVACRNQDLIASFMPQPGGVDVGLDALQVMSTNEIYFSVKTGFYSQKLGRQVQPGDLLSSRGLIVKSNAELLARFYPAFPKQDYGLDGCYVWPSGEIWFSTETAFYGSHFDSYAAGDLLSDQGYVVYHNLDLLSAFQPLETLSDFGLDALFVLADAALASGSSASVLAIIPTAARATPALRWQATGRLFQLERAASLSGPWMPVGPITQGSLLEDPGALTNQTQAFYRVRQW
ncbi:MAG: hypothetical protein NTW03_14215 [Verrucomicrobia bacterium]|nr:hypothetical protein [Verrucomicrobiota bacterium]